jgi:hypothetical protein
MQQQPKEPNGHTMEINQQDFDRILSSEQFKGLKAILDSLSPDRQTLCEVVRLANSYKDVVARLGYDITLTEQIHIQDCYARVGPAGGIKTVLPYYDIPTQGSMPTLVNFDSTITTTPQAVRFFNELLLLLKARTQPDALK